MIGKVLRGRHVGGLLRYLFGPGRCNQHVDPHLVAAWDDDPAGLEPGWLTDGRRDVRRLSGLLEQPLAVAVRPPVKPVWHCAVRTAPTDKRLSDAEWRNVARDIVQRTGLAPDGDDGACRWVAVRHADDHIHLVVTLARQDGAPARTGNDFYRVGEACRAAEDRLGLRRTAGRDRTAARRPTRGETEKAARVGRGEPARVRLQREVRTAAAAAATADEFLARLTDAGLLVRPRYSDRDPGRMTGYAVAIPGDRSRDGRPIWFGGAKLAADLSWPKLTSRWPDAARRTDGRPATATSGQAASSGRRRLSGHDRRRVWDDAAAMAATAAEDVARLAATDPDAASDLAHATADALSVTARVVEGRRGGPLTDAADAYDRAGRELFGRTSRRTPSGTSLRAIARLLALTGRASKDETTQVLALVANLAALADAVAQLRDVQRRAAQAAAARTAADHLARATHQPPPHRAAAAAVHRPVAVASVHRSPAASGQLRSTRRKVQP